MRKCRFCAEEIQDAAIVCKHCGRDLIPGRTTAPVAAPVADPSRTTIWNPGVAAVLSFFIPGLGQLYKGQIGKGLLFLVMSVAGYFMLIVPGLILHIVVIVDAYGGGTPAPTLSPAEAAQRDAYIAEYNKVTPEQRRAKDVQMFWRFAALVVGLIVLGALAIAISVRDPLPSRATAATAAAETQVFVERRMIYNALLMGGRSAEVAKRYRKTVEEIEIIRAEGKSRGWELEAPGNAK